MINTFADMYKMQTALFFILWELPLAHGVTIMWPTPPLLLLIRPEGTPGPKVGPGFSLLGIENWAQKAACRPLLVSQAVEILGGHISIILLEGQGGTKKHVQIENRKETTARAQREAETRTGVKMS